jgi:hypothetical protein
MAAIRDYATNYTNAASTSLPAYLPNYQQNDLLIAIVNVAVTSATCTASGWTQLSGTAVTGLNTFILYKIAGASETDPTFTISSSAGGVYIMSIQDVNYKVASGATGIAVGGAVTPFNGTGGAGATGIITTSGTANQSYRNTMPQLTTTANNSLLLYIVTTTPALVPVVLEGPSVYLWGADYSSNVTPTSSALSYGWKKTAGLTPNNVYYSITSTGAANTVIRSTLAISPPNADGTVNLLPTYCAADSSIYIDPINGTNAFGTNSAFAVFGGASGATGASGVNVVYPFTQNTLPGSTSAFNNTPWSSGTVTAAGDSGVNPYHSMGQMAHSTVSPRTWKGAILALGASGAFGNRNIIIHAKPQTPAAYENTDQISRPLTRGIAIGLESGATGSNYTIWHTHGAGTVYNSATHVPMIINMGATGPTPGATSSSVFAKKGSVDTTNVRRIGFFTSAIGASGPAWQFGSAWALDTTVIAGGNSTVPVNTKGLVFTAGIGKERMSVIQQGLAQALVLQPIQFGNGGTDPIYLNLDSSAIEFPSQYNRTTEQVFYNSYDNVVGLTYYAGGNDTIIHSNATIISQNKYFWGFNPNTAPAQGYTGATGYLGASGATGTTAYYNFAGTVISGAGTITLSANAPLTSLTFQNCDEIPQNNALLTSCVFSSTQAGAAKGAVLITGSTQSALQIALNQIVTSSFTNNTNCSGALHIQYTGTGGSRITLTNPDKSFSGNTVDIYWDAPANTPLTFTQTTTTANASTSTATNSNTVTINNTTTFVTLNFATGSAGATGYLIADGALGTYACFYNQVNTTGVGTSPGISSAYGTSKAVLVKSLSTDPSGDGSYQIKGNLGGATGATGVVSSVTFNYDYIYNTQAYWTANTPYKVGDEYCIRVGATTTWRRVLTNYTSSTTWTSGLDGAAANSVVITGPTIVLVTVGHNNADYFSTTGTIVPFQTTIINSNNPQELNYFYGASGATGTNYS